MTILSRQHGKVGSGSVGKRWLVAATAAFALSLPAAAQHGGAFPQVIDAGATLENKLGASAALDLQFTDETARKGTLLMQLSGERPVILNPGYFRCPGMCGFVLNAFLDNLEESGIEPGRDFDLVTLSIAPDENARLAADKKATYVQALARHTGTAPAWTEDWRFLTGDEAEILALTDSIGWRFRKDEHSGEYDHSPNLVVLTSDGVVSRYLDARYLTPGTLRAAVIEAGQGQVGTFVDRLLTSCLTFDPRTHAYTVTAMTVMQIGGTVTVLALALMIFVLWRRERARQRLVEAAS